MLMQLFLILLQAGKVLGDACSSTRTTDCACPRQPTRRGIGETCGANAQDLKRPRTAEEAMGACISQIAGRAVLGTSML